MSESTDKIQLAYGINTGTEGIRRGTRGGAATMQAGLTKKTAIRMSVRLTDCTEAF